MWFFYAIAASVIWGLEYVLLERLFQDRLAPAFVLAVQMSFGAVVFGAVAFLSRDFFSGIGHLARDPGSLRFIAVSATAFIAGSYLIALSIKGGNAVTAGLVEISYPLFIILFSALLMNSSRLDARTGLGGGLIVLGVLILRNGA